MLKRFIIDVPYNSALSRVYYYNEEDIRYKYLNGGREYLCPISDIGKSLEDLIDKLPVHLKVITDEDEITRILTMYELVT